MGQEVTTGQEVEQEVTTENQFHVVPVGKPDTLQRLQRRKAEYRRKRSRRWTNSGVGEIQDRNNGDAEEDRPGNGF